MTTILVIEDELPLLEEIIDRLQFEDFAVIGARDGLEGVQAAREHLPDLIVCDILMAGLDGYEVLREIHNDSALVNTPFIFLTARAEHEDVRRGMESGADDYLTKPFSVQELLNAIHTQLRKRAQQEQERWQNFTRRLVDVQENERRQVALYLHNDIEQLITSLKLSLNIVKDLPTPSLSTTFQETQALVDTLAAHVNALALDLWPVMLEHLGLFPALVWQVERFSTQTGIKVDFKHRGIERSFSLELKTAVYRILYEALANILQHAQTASVQIWVWIEDDRLKITIEDHGKGFELDAGFANARGLITMQERAALLAGKLTVSSQVGVGTLIMLDVPVADVPNGKVQPTTIKTPVPIPIRNGTTILLAETHATIREKLCQLLNQPNLNLVGEADNCTGMLAKVASRTPEILIVDLTLPGLNGLKPLQLVREQSPQTRILALLPQAEGVYVAQAFQYGASGCLLKSDCGEELLPAVRAIIAGQQYLSPALAKTSQNYTERSPETAQLDGYETLTSREREILLLVAQNHTSSEIADLLTISPRMAEVHRANLMRKLGLRNKADVIRYALKHSLVV